MGELPCVIDFHDDFCPPCKAVGPALDRLAIEYQGSVEFYEVDIKQEEVLAQELGVKNLPTIVFCPVDKLPMVIERAVSEDRIKSTIVKELLIKNKI